MFRLMLRRFQKQQIKYPQISKHSGIVKTAKKLFHSTNLKFTNISPKSVRKLVNKTNRAQAVAVCKDCPIIIILRYITAILLTVLPENNLAFNAPVILQNRFLLLLFNISVIYVSIFLIVVSIIIQKLVRIRGQSRLVGFSLLREYRGRGSSVQFCCCTVICLTFDGIYCQILVYYCIV